MGAPLDGKDEAEDEVGEAEDEGEKMEPEAAALGGAGALRCGTRFISSKLKQPARLVKAPSLAFALVPMPWTPWR